jgi:hypothetical protein
MYTACTFRLASVLDLPYLFLLPKLFIFAALAVWSIAFAAMIFSILRNPPENQ